MTLEQLEQQLAAIPSDDALPASTTRGELAAIQARRATLDHRIVTARTAMATLAELSDDADAAWLGHLEEWRKTLCDELLTIKSPIRDRVVMGRSQNLTLSIRTIDFGLGQLRDSGRELTNLRLGELMVASGYEVIGADPAQNFVGQLPWRGSTKEVEKRMKETERRRAQAEQQLAGALLDDDLREKQEAEARRLRDAYNAMDVRVGGPRGLRVVDNNNDDVDEATLTDLQREALAKARAAFSEPVAS